MKNDSNRTMVSPNDLYSMAVKNIGKEPETPEEKRIALFIMACPIHPAIRRPAARLLNRLYNFNVEEEYIETVCAYWNSHSWEDFVNSVNFLRARRN